MTLESGNKSVSPGSGLIVENGYDVTNRHLVKRGRSGL
jgi:hypothetical protein